MNPRITDAGVAGLALHEGRAELLEEIMAITPLEAVEKTADTPPSRPGRWVSAVVAAAAVAAVVGGVIWLGDQKVEPRGEDLPVATAPGTGAIAVLDVPGWTAAYGAVGENGGELSYRAGKRSLDIHWRAKAQYDAYVADRNDIGASEDVEVLGHPALLWAYSPKDHTVIREVVGDFTLEVRGSGMAKAAFLTLLGQLTAVAPAELDASLPDEFVTDAERADVIEEILKPIPVPAGFDRAIESHQITRYQLGADVTGPVACAWAEQWLDATRAGDQARAQEAVDAMATSRSWPILDEMAKTGDWPSVIRDHADQMAAGTLTREHLAGIGCDGDGSAEPADSVG